MEKFLGVLVNAGAILLGGLIGALIKKGIPKRITKAIMVAVGLCVIYIGIDNALKTKNAIVLVVSVVLGTFLGSLIRIDDGLNKFGTFIERKFTKEGENSKFAEGFVTATLVFCVGAMAIVGSLNAGISGDNEILYTKSILDCITATMLASTLGFGVMLSALPVLIYQGAICLLANVLNGVLTEELIAEITGVGGITIMAIGIGLTDIKKIKVADMIPSLLIVPAVYYLFGLINVI